MSWLKCLAVAGIVAAEAGSALAADLPALLTPVAVPPIVDFRYGWYLRGDIGFAWGAIGGAQSALGFPNPSDVTLGNGFVGGVGAGVRGPWLRTELTLDYTSSLNFTATIAGHTGTSAKVEAVTALINGYVDLGTWYRVTPYIGGGLGAAQLYVSDYSSAVAPPFFGGLSRTQYNLAWAAMAGVGYAVAPNTVVDLGYRYVRFGDVTTASDGFGAMALSNLGAHEIRIGFRWCFDDLPLVY